MDLTALSEKPLPLKQRAGRRAGGGRHREGCSSRNGHSFVESALTEDEAVAFYGWGIVETFETDAFIETDCAGVDSTDVEMNSRNAQVSQYRE